MLILSQDKEAIHNFNNIMSIQIERSNDNYKLYVYDTVDYDTLLGEYDTKERAKEILQEIIYKYTEYAEISNNRGITGIHLLPKVYEMPEK